MDRQRIGKSHRSSAYHTQLLHAMHEHLPARGLPLISGDKRLRWTDRLLVTAAILMTWTPAGSLREAFAAAREVVVSMYVSRRRPGRSFQGFIDTLARRSDELIQRIRQALQRSLIRRADRQWRWRSWAVMAVDGSRINCPRTLANEAGFGRAGRRKTTPQQYLTTIFHVASGLVWDWRSGRGNASEREHLRQMLRGLPRRSLLLMDAGYTGFDLLRRLSRSGHGFIVRVGRNVTLLQKLGWYVRERKGIVYLWPQTQRKRAPLVLRQVRVCSQRGRLVCLLTNVLDERRLPDAQAARWYRHRWLVEVRYRGLKQTLGKRKMLSDTPTNARVELHWAIVGLALLGLMAATSQGRPEARWSVAKVLSSVRRAMRGWHGRPPAGGLRGQFRQALVDQYARHRPKQARAWPHKKNEPPCGTPKLRTATAHERRLAKGFHYARTTK